MVIPQDTKKHKTIIMMSILILNATWVGKIEIISPKKKEK